MKKIQNIAVVTGSRAEYGILKPLLMKIQRAKGLNLFLYVTGMHLLKKYGNTADVIGKDGFTIVAKIPMYGARDDIEGYVGAGLSRGIENFTSAFCKNRPDMALVFGDRFESLAATLAAAILNIPVGHIHGGDKTDSGHIDECTRHAITRYSHIHFAPTKAAVRRLIHMGEERFRIYLAGTLGIDNILETPKLTKPAVCKPFGFNSAGEIMVCLFNPLPLEAEKMAAQAKEIFAAIRIFKKQTVVIYPNNDAGSTAIINEIKKIRKSKLITVVKNLPSEQYINLLRHADVLIGNSSSGIVEAPTLKLPVVNIGSRNVGREHAQNVIFAAPEKKAIQRAIEKALYDKKFQRVVKGCKNPYGSGTTADAIINVLKKLSLDKRLMLKRLTF